MVSCPLLTPLTFLCADTSEMLQRNGSYGSSVPCVGQISGRCYCPEFSLRKFAAHNSARPAGAGRLRRNAAKSSASIKRLSLGAPDVPVGPSLLDARPKGVASQGKVWGSQEGQGNLGVPAPLAPAAGRRQSPAAKGGHCTRSPRAGLSHPAHRTVHSVLRPVRCVLRRMPQRRVQHRTRRHNAHHCPRDRSRRDTRYKW